MVEEGREQISQDPLRHESLDDICALPVEQWVDENAVLFLWFTFPLMEQVMSPRITWNDDGTVTIKPRIYEAWGFKYSQIAWVWRKYNEETGKFAYGPGTATRKNLEPCIICWRGNNEVFDKTVRDFIDDFMDEKRREHSQKPDKQYENIEAMFDGPYLEMFATQPRDGWDRWAPKAHAFRD